MEESLVPEPKRHRSGEALEKMDDDLPPRIVDITVSEAERRWSTYFYMEKLLSFVAKQCGILAPYCSEACRYYREIDDPRIAFAMKRPKVEVCKFISDHEQRVLAYLSESSDSFPEETASMYERLEAAWFENYPRSAVRKTLQGEPQLVYFRMAQEIRVKHNLTRMESSLPCFNSFEDIKRLEERLADNDPVDFMLQCIELADTITIGGMYDCIKTHSQLLSFHLEVSRLGKLDETCEYMYEERFESLLEDESLIPMWNQLEKYLEKSSSFPSGLKPVFASIIPHGKLDEALRRITEYLMQCFARMTLTCIFEGNDDWEITTEDVEVAVQALMPLVIRGASLDYREPHVFLHCEQSTLSALIELADLVSIFPIEEFFPYVCCPLSRKGGEVKFDDSRPARLTCLAARSVKNLGELSQLPPRFRSFVRMHQDLRKQLSNNFLRIAVARRRILGDSLALDSDPENLYEFARRIDWRLRPDNESDSDDNYE